VIDHLLDVSAGESDSTPTSHGGAGDGTGGGGKYVGRYEETETDVEESDLMTLGQRVSAVFNSRTEEPIERVIYIYTLCHILVLYRLQPVSASG